MTPSPSPIIIEYPMLPDFTPIAFSIQTKTGRFPVAVTIDTLQHPEKVQMIAADATSWDAGHQKLAKLSVTQKHDFQSPSRSCHLVANYFQSFALQQPRVEKSIVSSCHLADVS